MYEKKGNINRGKRVRPLRILTKRSERIFLTLVFLPITAGAIYGIYRYGSTASPLFWVAGAIEVISAFFTVIPERWRVLRLILFVVSGTLPLYLGTNVESLRPIKNVWLIYGLAGGWIAFYRIFRPRKYKLRMKPLSHGFTLPAYLPQGFRETDRSEYERKGYRVTELIYGNGDTGYVMWIKEANGPILDYEPRKNMQVTEKTVKDVVVHIEQEILKPDSKRAQRGEPSFIEINWSYEGINFNLRSDGLTLDEAEKIITSMIQ